MEPYKPQIIITLLYIIVAGLLYAFLKDIANSSFFSATITFLVGSLAIYLYIKQKVDAKRDAARIIIQEIRRAEDIINDYKQMGAYQFAKKIIATNSWTKNIHYFVGDLTNDEMDKISDLYSTGEYLDRLVEAISQITLEYEVNFVKEIITATIQQPPQQGTTYFGAPQGQQQIMVPNLPAVWKPRLDTISLKIQPIYHSTIVGKLKEIAKVN